ncbi:AAA family ATPase [Glaesserella parasuis]|uniref:AAA family ATPase n=1 Tax=Glaesserella parasuis TaxID=738 RepID=UPI0013533C94|nr:AAA family ATPase [Glaesserella parasuis]MDG6369811.1 AAA family ATPase [Glaesserella parasuis]MDG6844613.1 AAA family ATPase [Glaesserella parasuis]MDO9805515.1 AAA family ATPase [Glaesserella parasuis]MDO9942728.1 AAA family ATPase [Glaesserella parasuis]MDO9998195.1 AAA family ATPase [Glaesserella parasuis]
MQVSPLSLQSLSVHYPFKQTDQAVRFLDFQPNTQQAMQQFALSEFGSALILKTEPFPEFLNEITDYFENLHCQTVLKTEFNRQSLFGYSLYLEKENQIKTVAGAIEQAHQGILILNVSALLLDIVQWDKLKQALLFGQFDPIIAGKLPEAIMPIQSQFKLILVGSRDDIATLHNYDEDLYQFCQYAEIESYLNIDEENSEQWGSYIQSSAKKYLNRTFSKTGLNQLLHYYIRESENQTLISISPTLLKKHLLGLQHFYPKQTQFNHIQDYFDYLEKQSGVLNKFVLNDILNHQLYIETEEETIGQINGLSVVEFDGVPHSFGEPLRISCNVQYGDGEIHDIERKVELGGNIHSKGIIIAQSCLANLLELPTQLPFSASVAFEQSYGEIDGDSSSLAIFCVLISALTKLPLPQSLAVTGAIDQFGNVLSVGGVNQKIEGFFNVCEARELTGKQGVIIPAVCVSHLSLKPAVLSAIEAGKFHIWAVEDVFEALQILLQHPFYDEDLPENSEKKSLFALVHQGIEQNENEDASGSIFHKIRKLLKGH